MTENNPIERFNETVAARANEFLDNAAADGSPDKDIRFDNDGDIIAVGDIDAVGFVADYDGADHEYPVEVELDKYASVSYYNWDGINDAVWEAYSKGFTGLGAILEPMGDPVNADAHTDNHGSPRHGGGHLCETVLKHSNARSIRAILEQNGAHYFEDAGMFFYDLGRPDTVELVVQIERGLSDYPIIDDMDHSELEQQIIDEMFQNELPNIDFTVDEQEIYEAWTDQDNGSYCPECGTGKNVHEILEESNYKECDTCFSWFDPTHGFATEDECSSCVKEARTMIIGVKQRYGFYLDTGEELLIRFNDGQDYMLENGSWVPVHVDRDDHVYGR